jgi:cytoskeletal protein CcmA (bactofilin family)
VTVHGKVHGNITAERCELKSNCTVEGDLKAARLIIEDGATFIGTSQISPKRTLEVVRDLFPNASRQKGKR